MNDRGWFWIVYAALLAGLLAWTFGCASGWTPAEEERLYCRVFAENVCGRDGASGPCRSRAYRECAALERRAAQRCQAGKL